MVQYITFLCPENKGYYTITPDLKGCFSQGDNFQEAIEMTIEACELYCEDLKELPKAHPLDYFTQDKLKELNIPLNAMPQLINIKIEKTVRINMTFPSDLLKQVDEMVKNLKTNRSAFFQELAKREIATNYV